MKSSICGDWARARERQSPPEDAPLHWGCPRGARCTFAHGKEELQGGARQAADRLDEEAKRASDSRSRDEYVSSAMSSSLSEGLVYQGLSQRAEAANQAKDDALYPIAPTETSRWSMVKPVDETKTLSQQPETEELPLDDYGF